MKKRLVLLFAVSLFATSCSTSYSTRIDVVTGTPQIKSTNFITLTETPSPFPLLATLTSTPLASAKPNRSPTPNTGVAQSCISVQSDPPEKDVYSGTLVMLTRDPEIDYAYSFYDLGSRELSVIPGANYFYFSISPDHTMYAYKNNDTRRLEVFSVDGLQIKSLTWRDHWAWINRWIDEKTILIVTEYPQVYKYPRDYEVFNLFTDQVLENLPSDYPDIDQISNLRSWGYSGTTAYNSSLTRVIYPGDMQVGDYRGLGYVLYSIPEQKKLAELPVFRNRIPVWSPNDSQFIVMGGSEFYLVSYDGIVSKITHMNPRWTQYSPYETDEGSDLDFFSEYYSWSPDGRHVALWLFDITAHQETLAILDTQTGGIINTCIPAGYNDNEFPTFPYPVWLSDGKTIAILANYRQQDNGYDAVLVDLEDHTAYTLGANQMPVGWLASP